MLDNGSFPHPVIGHSDDVNSVLTLSNIDITTMTEDIRVDFRIETDDSQLVELVDDGSVEIVAMWTCGATLGGGRLSPSSLVKTFDGWEATCFLDQQEVRDGVEVSVELVAARSLENFRWERQHEDYENTTFAISTGDYLGLVGEFSFNADKVYDSLNPPLTSVFRIIERASQVEPMILDHSDGPQVTIYLSAEMAKGVRGLGYYSSMKLALVVLPALMETFATMARETAADGEGLSQTGWFRSLEVLLAKHDADVSRPLEAAQKILNNPTIAAINSLEIEEDD